ncbi:MAG: ABC transporter substrate-binding protein [Saprospiraceae bacterium]|nr:ABC transporter substrate-binding protein [Saprospiraceae bacterium]
MKISLLPCVFALALLGALLACHPAKQSTSSTPGRPDTGTRPSTGKPRYEPMDTVRWAPAPGAKPPIGTPPGSGQQPGNTTGQSYRLALLLPFLTNQIEDESGVVPEKSRLALQFYAGADLALQRLSTEEGLDLSVDVFDTQVNDADFQRLLSNPRLDKAQVLIGPIRTSHVRLLAERIKKTRQILISPESPEMDLTSANPGFIQTNPSLRAHCHAIARFVLKRHRPDEVVLICKEKEAGRLPFFQQSIPAGSTRFAELIVPDAIANFDNIDLKPYLKAGRNPVFILPTWSSQDFVMAFLRKLRNSRGSTSVEVFGMPQWKNFENIEPEYFADLKVHITAASYVDYHSPEARAFQQAFYDKYGTLPDDDACNGYDVVWFAGKMLKKYGLSFPERLSAEPLAGLHGALQFAKVSGALQAVSGDQFAQAYDYQENIFVHILAFQKYQFLPVE